MIKRVVEDLFNSSGDFDEVVLVNDGSTDASEAACRELVHRHAPRVTYVQLSRNYGEYAAVSAGLRYSHGSHVAIVDDDGQQAPADVARLFDAAERYGYDVVYGRYVTLRQPWHRRAFSRVHNLTAGWLLGKPRDLSLSSFKVVNRFIVDQVCAGLGPFTYLDGLILQTTGKIAQLEVSHRDRLSGRSGYSVFRLWSLWWNIVMGFSGVPFQLAIVLGILAGCGGIVELLRSVLGNASDLAADTMRLPALSITVGGGALFYIGYLGEYLRKQSAFGVGRSPFVVRYVLREDSTHE